MSGLMKPISQLRLGFSDAENYRRSENKNLFAQVFVRNQMLEQVFDPSISFVVGEKGTGKTAYAVYISNTTYREHRAAIKYIRETEYQKFVAMKRERHLGLSDYVSIWKTIICLMLAQKIRAERQVSLLTRLTTFPQLIRAIDEYYAGAFSPEIVHAIQFVESSGLAATLLSKHAQAEVTHQQTETFSEARFQTNLLYIQKRLEDALRSLKLPRSQLLFVDGIDIRPSSIPYEDYLECIKGLAGAVWELNNDFFPSIKDSPGRMRTVLLIRPDIFQFLGLQNQNTKIRDNSVLLDWRTTYVDHRSSSLFEVSDTLLGVQQEQHCELGEAWDHYFPFDSRNVVETFNTPSSFVGFLRLSLHRPRDIVTMLGICKKSYLTIQYLTLQHRKRDIFRSETWRAQTFEISMRSTFWEKSRIICYSTTPPRNMRYSWSFSSSCKVVRSSTIPNIWTHSKRSALIWSRSREARRNL